MAEENKALFLVALVLFSAAKYVQSHTSIAHPTPISFHQACRLGNGVHCPGPCPNQLFRRDKPIKLVRRGQLLRVRTKKNNHFGGFARWSIVKVKDMWKKHKHKRGAFKYSCHDLRLRHCKYENRLWCKGDRTDQYYSHSLWIPKIYPDGDYVLGFAWYGGLFSTKDIGNFGDYYDCMYLRIQGGTKGYSYTPTFNAGPSATGRGGYCSSTVNKLGYCWKEPCNVNGKNRPAQLLKPWEFEDDRRPPPIRASDYE